MPFPTIWAAFIEKKNLGTLHAQPAGCEQSKKNNPKICRFLAWEVPFPAIWAALIAKKNMYAYAPTDGGAPLG